MATQAQLAAVQQLYVGYLGRAADAEGQKFWADAIANGTATIASVATGFTLSAEYQAAYAGLDSAALVDKIYTNVLGRAADAEGKAFWVAALANGTVAADTLLATMITNLGALDQQTINNKVFVAQTYTDTVGADYNPEGGAEVISKVTNDPASVTEALQQIANGSVNGQVPALGLINALAAANASEAAFADANKGAVESLAETLKVTLNPADSFADKLDDVYGAATAARDAIPKSTSVLAAEAGDAAKLTAADYAKLNSAGKAKADAYVAAVKAEAALTGAKAADVTAVKAGLDADVKFIGDSSATPPVVGDVTKVDAAIKAVNASYTGTITTADQLYTYYTEGKTTAEERAAIDAVLKDVPYYSTFKATAEIDSAKNVAKQKVSDAKSDADQAYVSHFDKQGIAEKVLADAKAADVNVDAAKALVDAYKVQTDAVTAAEKAISDFNGAHTDVAAHDFAVSLTGSDTVKDVFYFADKATAASDYTIAAKNFGAGDSIVIGNGATYNSGALTTGDNNKSEFFLVQKGNDTLVILETDNFGSSTTTHTATGDATAVDSPNAAVITLTGVNVADLTVNNGVISHVA